MCAKKIGDWILEYEYKVYGPSSSGVEILKLKDQNVVLKKIPIHGNETQIKSEYSKLEKLRSCPHICTVAACFPSEVASQWGPQRCFCVLMEFCEKGDLSKRITWAATENKHSLTGKGSAEDEKQIIRWISSLVEGVTEMHNAGIMHRDLKPQNLLLDKQDNLKIGDLGSATEKIEAETVIGTIGYFAPEIISRGCYTKAADLWSVGCVILDVLTLSSWWNSGTLEARIKLIPATYSPKWGNIVRSLLNENAEERMSLTQLRKGLQQIREIYEPLPTLGSIQRLGVESKTRTFSLTDLEGVLEEDDYTLQLTFRSPPSPSSPIHVKAASKENRDEIKKFLSHLPAPKEEKDQEAKETPYWAESPLSRHRSLPPVNRELKYEQTELNPPSSVPTPSSPEREAKGDRKSLQRHASVVIEPIKERRLSDEEAEAKKPYENGKLHFKNRDWGKAFDSFLVYEALPDATKAAYKKPEEDKHLLYLAECYHYKEHQSPQLPSKTYVSDPNNPYPALYLKWVDDHNLQKCPMVSPILKPYFKEIKEKNRLDRRMFMV